MAPTSSLQSLPTEIVQNIVQHLNCSEPASQRAFDHEPSAESVNSNHKPLKQLSLASRFLRGVVFQSLFTYLLCVFDDFSTAVDPGTYCLQKMIKLVRLIQKLGMEGKIHGLTVFFPVETCIPKEYIDELVNRFTTFLICDANPLRLTVIGPASLLCHLIQDRVDSKDEWAFGKRLHMLRLSQLPHPSRRGDNGAHGFVGGIIKSRPWTDLSVNEGSSLRVYSTYEYFNKTPPTMLHQLFRMAVDSTLLHSLRRINYVAIFPLSSQVRGLAQGLRDCPSLTELFTQLAPAAADPILDDSERLGKASTADIWMEVESSYRLIASEIATSPPFLQRWETADKDIGFDALVRPLLTGWESLEPLVWTRSA
ncbi:MAG: hypothetical protein Q9222_007697 [Ikaeria aurantiellina]